MQNITPRYNFFIITPFKELIDCYFNSSILKKAQQKGLINIHFINPRNFTNDKHKTIDDKPFGGGPGMVYMLEPFEKAIIHIKNNLIINNGPIYTVLFSPTGDLLNDQFVQDFTRFHKNHEVVNFILIIPRYEGIDARIINFVDLNISLGPYILTGAELAASIFIDSIARFIPNVLGNQLSNQQDTTFKSYSNKIKAIQVIPEAPVYTRPQKYKSILLNKTLTVPEVLVSGNHAKIIAWKKQFNKPRPIKLLEWSPQN